MQDIKEIEDLIKLISKLPGLGPKSARRILLKLINNKKEIYKPLVNAMAEVFKNVIRCKNCGSLCSIQSACQNCEIKEKVYNKICIVETIADQWAIQSSNIFSGYFHILGGTLSPTNQRNNKHLLIDELINRIKKNNINEVILATSATIEGQTTAYYIQDSLKHLKINISRLGQGIPIGGEIENLDDGTLISAFKNRKEII